MISLPNSNSFVYFERRSDGTLQELFETDNPFNAVDAIGRTTFSDYVGEFGGGAGATLGDWNGDGEVDLIVVDPYRVSLWINRPFETFVEVAHSKNPFNQLRFPTNTRVSLVNVTEKGGQFDLVVPNMIDGFAGMFQRQKGNYRYFRRQSDGELVEQHGDDNPFDGLDLDFDLKTRILSIIKSLVADVDGDGDLDILGPQLAYRRNDHGHFRDLTPSDPANPFHGIEDTLFSFGTFVDWDHDGDLDFVQVFGDQEIPLLEDANATQADIDQFEAGLKSEASYRLRFYRQDGDGPANITFSELTGPENPFHHIGALRTAACPAVVDLDRDGQWELVLSMDIPGEKSSMSPLRDFL
eukprot:Skav208668  [mRNA]  locus=scaffold775:26441:27502:+ [translate_table: standard]